MIVKKYILFFFLFLSLKSIGQQTAKITIQYNPSVSANRFKPSECLGAAFDGHWQGDMDRIIRPDNIKAMQSVGLKPVSYRLRTELGCEVWHWNPKGRWSDATHQQGYWTSSEETDSDIQISNGYNLPRRGNTHDQANDNGYSRIDDGDTSTFWKSNPYLDSYYTHEPDSLHPQWVVVDLGKLMEVNAIRINWGLPYALSYQVDYALDIGKDYFEPYQPGLWRPFANRNITGQKGENVIVRLGREPLKVRFIRIMMYRSSHTSLKESKDIRDRLGFAIKEIEAGTVDRDGTFHDLVIHGADNQKQSVVHVSSNDPWHRASDIDIYTEQAGIDRFFKSGLSNGQPAMLPVGLLYDTPENMIALLHYVQKKHYPVSDLEMGEEPEGQLIHPNDYAALYVQWGDVIKKILPDVKLGGPGFASLSKDKSYGDPNTFSEREWTDLFVKYLKKHKRLGLFNFFSFEWYPFDDICDAPGPQLRMQPAYFYFALKPFKEKILPAGLPIYITEYGYSAYGGRSEVDIEGALMYADIIGQFYALGGSKSFLYGYEPTYLEQTNDCDYGNNMLFGMDENGKIIYRVAAYNTVKMMVGLWAQPSDSVLEAFPVSVEGGNHQLISAYALLKPDHKWSVAIINKDGKDSKRVVLSVLDILRKKHFSLKGKLHVVQYGASMYHWKNNGSEGFPDRDLPPVEFKIGASERLMLPAYSLTVVEEDF